MGFVSDMNGSLKSNRKLRGKRKKIRDKTAAHTPDYQTVISEEDIEKNKKAFSDYTRRLEAEANKKSIKPFLGVFTLLLVVVFMIFYLLSLEPIY